jgi:hypothetical protein
MDQDGSKDSSDIFVRVTLHKGNILVIEGPAPGFEHEDWQDQGTHWYGCRLRNTKQHLGISAEALTVLKTLPVSGEVLADVMWWNEEHLQYFAWCGSSLQCKWPGAEAGADYAVQEGQYNLIPNDVPLWAVMYCAGKGE